MRYVNAVKHSAARWLGRFELVRALRRTLLPAQQLEFRDSESYWKERYERGGNSGEGSYGPLADYKADFINDFCSSHSISSAVELGCGDGNQASKLKIERYVGVDISEKCIAWARRHFDRSRWEFLTADEFRDARTEGMCELGLSLDVTYHLIEDEVYRTYLQDLFGAASRYVLIYSSNLDYFDPAFPHVRHRPVVRDVAALQPEWSFVRTERNPYHRHPDERRYGSFAEFHIFEKRR